jgi:soluble lytic murein transglycosylase-like protein
MTRLKGSLLFSALFAASIGVAATTPANAQSANYAAPHSGASVPSVLNRSDRQYYREVFRAIDRQDWARVDSLLASRSNGVLHQMALAEYYTHANSPKVSADQIARWFNAGAHLPQSEQLQRLGEKRGVSYLPALPQSQSFTRQPSAPKRIRPRRVDDGTMPSSVKSAILDRIKNDDPYGAEALLRQVDPSLSSAARAEWRQRVAWSYYIENQDRQALALARTVSEGSGPWVAEGEWVAGLAAWRLNDCASAAQAFANGARLSRNIELASAANYWAGRAYMRCRRPGDSDEHLRKAAAYDETLYGMLASEQLGARLPDSYTSATFSRNDWQRLRAAPNVEIAAALAEIGRSELADEVLRHQARIGSPRDFDALSRFARALGMPRTQLWMAHNAPRGAKSERAMRYPIANWQPANGWSVDPSLAFAHALQESNFRPSVVSPAKARGLMQIMPGTARDHNRSLNLGASSQDLNKPEVNLAYGQRHLEMLRDSAGTQGRLPKIMAAYNAGLSPIKRWNNEIDDRDDPLLWMESIPYWETRGYVAIVMRNFWMYQRQDGAETSPSRTALAQGQWPEFPRATRVRTASRVIERRENSAQETGVPPSIEEQLASATNQAPVAAPVMVSNPVVQEAPIAEQPLPVMVSNEVVQPVIDTPETVEPAPAEAQIVEADSEEETGSGG